MLDYLNNSPNLVIGTGFAIYFFLVIWVPIKLVKMYTSKEQEKVLNARQ